MYPIKRNTVKLKKKLVDKNMIVSMCAFSFAGFCLMMIIGTSSLHGCSTTTNKDAVLHTCLTEARQVEDVCLKSCKSVLVCRNKCFDTYYAACQ